MQDQADQSYTSQILRSVIIHSLDQLNYCNAEFACERLLANDATNLDSIYLYCLTQFRQGKYKSCFNRSSNLPDHLGCSYMYAKSCLQLKKYKEGIFQLMKISYLYNENASYYTKNDHEASYFATPCGRYNYETSRSIFPDSSAVYHLLGDLNSSLGDVKSSSLNYAEALKFNQFDFEAFQKLCSLGVSVNTRAIFKYNQVLSSHTRGESKEAANDLMSNSVNDISNPFSASDTVDTFRNLKHDNQRDDSAINYATPRISEPMIPDAPLRKAGHMDQQGSRFEFTKPAFPSEPISQEMSIKKEKPNTYSKLTSKLISQPMTNPKHNFQGNAKSVSRLGVKRNSSNPIPISANTSNADRVASISMLTSREIELADEELLNLYIMFGRAFKCISKYDCYKAIRILDALPRKEKETPWVLSKLGRIHYELVNYKQSEYYFIKLRRLERTRLEDMEYYSTLLWHLHKKVELAFLANELHDLDSNSPITWCTIGNLFSLTREPDEAIKCFNKAIKCDESFTYAYTLKAHEFFGNDNYEMALENFRISLLHNPRHYNALYGIGMVYINLGDYQKADYHFRKAVSINPVNIILICCVGMVLEKIGKRSMALKQYELANKLSPLNPLPIFKRAQLLFAMQQYHQALESFKILKDLAPEEASVHFLLGQLYNIQNDKFSAIKEFTIAFNLDPKGNYLIREAMESLKDK